MTILAQRFHRKAKLASKLLLQPAKVVEN
jgi:hypothetical protein